MFSQRNRIISGLAQVVVIFEAAQKSGTMITAAWALDDGREVFAVPGSILSAYSEGTNSLIKQGAAPALSAGDILEALELPGKPDEPGEAAAPAPELTEPQRRIYAALEGGEMTLDELSAGTGMEPFVVLAELTGLEIEGAVVSKGGTRYARKA
jgi:DNA processing protein